jgi:acetate kinase
LSTRLNRHHVLLMSRSTGGFGATVCHLGGAAALAVAAASKPNVDTSMAMTDRSARLYVPA